MNIFRGHVDAKVPAKELQPVEKHLTAEELRELSKSLQTGYNEEAEQYWAKHIEKKLRKNPSAKKYSEMAPAHLLTALIGIANRLGYKDPYTAYGLFIFEW